MSVQSEMDRIKSNIQNTYSVLSDLGADVPSEPKSNNLAESAKTVSAVLFKSQDLTSEQKQQARANIEAAKQANVDNLSKEIDDHENNGTIHVTATEKQTWNGKVDKTAITLDKHTDGLIYIFIDGVKVGNGVEITGEVVEGDVVGTVDENNNLLLSGSLADGTYKVRYVTENGIYSDPITMVVSSIVTYAITQNLTNVTSSNSATSIREGQSFTANLTANDGYELKSVTVTMGGSPVTVSGGTINIASVTGDVVITAVATKPNYTNLFDPSQAQLNKRVSNSLELKDIAGHFATAFIDVSGKTPFTNATKIYVKGAGFTASASSGNQTKILSYATKPSTGYAGNYSVVLGSNITVTDEGNGVISVSNLASSFTATVKYMVLTLRVSDSNITTADIQNVVITIDEPIV